MQDGKDAVAAAIYLSHKEATTKLTQQCGERQNPNMHRANRHLETISAAKVPQCETMLDTTLQIHSANAARSGDTTD